MMRMMLPPRSSELQRKAEDYIPILKTILAAPQCNVQTSLHPGAREAIQGGVKGPLCSPRKDSICFFAHSARLAGKRHYSLQHIPVKLSSGIGIKALSPALALATFRTPGSLSIVRSAQGFRDLTRETEGTPPAQRQLHPSCPHLFLASRGSFFHSHASQCRPPSGMRLQPCKLAFFTSRWLWMPAPGPLVCLAQSGAQGMICVSGRMTWITLTSRSCLPTSGSAGMLSGMTWTLVLGFVLLRTHARAQTSTGLLGLQVLQIAAEVADPGCHLSAQLLVEPLFAPRHIL